jgi:hypothetical protein
VPTPTSPNRGAVKFGPKARESYLNELRQGLRPGQAARNAGTSRWTVSGYRRNHPEFAELENDAMQDSIELVEDALFQAAISGNVTACQVWLYNRSPDQWRDMRARDALAPGYSGAVTVDDEIRSLVAALSENDSADDDHGRGR